MTALSGTIGALRETIPGGSVYTLQARPSTTFRKGAIVVARIGSNLVEVPLSAAPRTDLVALGVVRATNAYTSDSATDSGGGAIDANSQPENITADSGVKGWFSTAASGANKITDAMRGQYAYAYDDDTWYATDNGGTLSARAYVDSVRADGRVAVRFDPPRLTPAGFGPAASQSPPFVARGVLTTLGANTGTTTGTLTITATGALSTVLDGLTPAAGDVVFIPEGTTNLAADSDAGPYEVLNPGATGVSPVLTRPAWWKTGAPIPEAAEIKIGAGGTLYPNTVWFTSAVKGKLIDTDSAAWFPRKVIQQVTLSSGFKAITNVPIRDVTKVAVTATMITGGTPAASTTSYQTKSSAAGIVAGKLGSGVSATVEAQSVAGTIVNTDAAKLNVSIENL